MVPRNVFREMDEKDEIFKDERPLQPEYLPEVLPHREGQVQEIAFSLRGAAKGDRPENVLIIGPPGTGKTSTVRFVFRQLSEFSQRVSPIYINCWEFSTRHGILTEIAMRLGTFVPRRGIATDEIIAEIVAVLRREKRIPVIALDEIDRLFANRSCEEKVLYDILRAGENFETPIGVIGITNSREFMVRVDTRIRSSLAQREIEFRPYTPAQLKDILQERARLAFVDGVLAEEVVPLCAAHAAKNGGDARLAIAMLWKAGKLAEKEGARRVEAVHCKGAFSSAVRKVTDERLEGLNAVERRILELARESEGLTSGELYALLSREFDETDRTVRNYLQKLAALKLIKMDVREKTKGQRGLTRIIRLA